MPIASNLDEAFAFTHEIESVYTKIKESKDAEETLGDFLKLAGELPAWAQPFAFFTLGVEASTTLDDEEFLEIQRRIIDHLFDNWRAEQPAAAARVA